MQLCMIVPEGLPPPGFYFFQVTRRKERYKPENIAVVIAYRIHDCIGSFRCVGILRAAENVARVVASPDPGLAHCLVVFPGQLLGGARCLSFSPKPWYPEIS